MALPGVVLSRAALADAADCHLNKISELPVRLERNQPIVEATVNGTAVRALLDTGAEMTVLSQAGAERLGLEVSSQHKLGGIGGTAAMGQVKLKKLSAGDWWADAPMVHVVQNDNFGPDVEMILGQDIFAQYDVELDFANGAVRFFEPKGCSGVPLAYWAQDYAEAALRPTLPLGHRDIQVRVALNDRETWALLDTGFTHSSVLLRTAHLADVHEDGPDVAVGTEFHGIGKKHVPTWIGTFASFTIGDETVRRVRLNVGDFAVFGEPDRVNAIGMFLGADFIKTHRIYIANSQGKVFFTNVGRPVFAPRTRDGDAVKATDAKAPAAN
ncbi:retroviral-like aspartic protease family protein [Nitrospirillum sp. BR 11164]|uniref:retroviral-like aspartic protease family protein n=1 Tax=Nitrospirillum sp. BR 11164 TaxID=3104324 RepID=UPI002AFF824B|nr:retroviral-like aspartic protease family protein [Nitrospirillum sp. BR 11164]MEA1651922.1 retroviral-like aspartic protease family protein [Nitrospirillum sp. BR 11164]